MGSEPPSPKSRPGTVVAGARAGITSSGTPRPPSRAAAGPVRQLLPPRWVHRLDVLRMVAADARSTTSSARSGCMRAPSASQIRRSDSMDRRVDRRLRYGSTIRMADPRGLQQPHRLRRRPRCGRTASAARAGRRPSGSGSRRTSAAQPSAASASRTWWSAAPQLMVSIRPAGSVIASCRPRSACRSRIDRSTRHRHGWVLWMDGANPAERAACTRCGGL